MAINVAGLVPASIKSKNVATEDYVDTSVANIDISQTLNTNNDVFAQRLGYLSYADMVASATNGKTIINGGYLRSELIEANSINANQINTTGLVAENISSNTIEGKTITGGTINGSIIIGATIRASYLELDGEIQVLTTFYLCVGGDTTGVPALAISEGRYRTYDSLVDTDAILPDGNTNIYKIPTLSFISEPVSNIPINNAGNFGTSTIRSYNNASAGHNLKSAKRQPTLLYIRSSVANINCPIPQWTIGNQFVYANSQIVQLYLFNSSIGTFQVRSSSELYSDGEGFAESWKTELYYNGSYQGKFEWSGPQGSSHVFVQYGNTIVSGVTNGINWEIKLIESGFLSVEVWADNVVLPVYFDNLNVYALKVVSNSNPDYTVNSLGSTYYRPTATITIGSGKLSINNML